MRIANRLIGFLFWVALGALGVIVFVETVLGLTDRPAWLIDRSGLDTTVSALSWSDRGVIIASIVLLVIGVLLIVAQLKPRRPDELAVPADREQRSLAIDRRGLEAHLGDLARNDADVAGASARVRRRRIDMDVSVLPDAPQPEVSKRVRSAAESVLGELGISKPKRVRVATNQSQERVR